MLPAPRPWSRERCSCRRSSCAGTVDDAIALAYGPNNPAASIVNRRALGSKLTGQQQIGRAVAHFIGVKLRNRISGRTRRQAEARARRDLDRLPKNCAVTVTQDASGVVVPVVGATCRGTVGDPGDVVDPDALRACLLPALEPETRDLAPQPASATTAR